MLRLLLISLLALLCLLHTGLAEIGGSRSRSRSKSRAGATAKSAKPVSPLDTFYNQVAHAFNELSEGTHFIYNLRVSN